MCHHDVILCLFYASCSLDLSLFSLAMQLAAAQFLIMSLCVNIAF